MTLLCFNFRTAMRTVQNVSLLTEWGSFRGLIGVFISCFRINDTDTLPTFNLDIVY